MLWDQTVRANVLQEVLLEWSLHHSPLAFEEALLPALAVERACNYVSLWNLNSPPIPLWLPVDWAVRFPPICTKQKRARMSKNNEKHVAMVMMSLLMSSPPISIRHLHISHSAPYLPPKFCLTFVYHFSWYYSRPKGNGKQYLRKMFGGQIRCTMGDVQVVYFASTFSMQIFKSQRRNCKLS